MAASDSWQPVAGLAPCAAAKADVASDYQSATRHLERGLTSVARLPDGRERLEHAFELHVEMQNALNCQGKIELVLEI